MNTSSRPDKEIEKSRNRLFNVSIVIAVVIVIAFTVREATVTASMMTEPNSSKGSRSLECASLPSRYSIHTVYEKETGMWVPYTEDGPTGVDGGLRELMSAYRTCSR